MEYDTGRKLADAQVGFLRAEIQTGFTMLELARTERAMHDPEAAAHAFANAHNALAAVKRFLPKLKNVQTTILDELRRGSEDLEGAIRQYEDPAAQA